MISSESSDEEFEALHRQHVPAAAPRKKRALSQRQDDGAATSKVSEDTAAAPEQPAAGNEPDDPDALTVLPEMSKEEKKAIRKKRRLERREQLAKQMEDQQRQQDEQERQLKGRPFTLSMAIPGSIIDNAQTKELKTYLAGQIARAAVIFQVDEIVVFDDQLGAAASASHARPSHKANDCHVFLSRILQYLETPQYLRRALFPMHSDLSCAGLLNPLDCPHHLRGNEWSVYREGVVVDRPLKDKEGSQVNVGLQREVVVDKRIQPGVRVTVKIDETTKNNKRMVGKLVSSAEPREQLGVYWGYTTRFAASLSHVWTNCPYPEGYDLKIGTSERGTISVDDADFGLPKYRHALVVFGGVAGIEECVNADETIPVPGDEALSLFDLWINTCPAQGSRTIRSEEAVLISLSALRKALTQSGKKG